MVVDVVLGAQFGDEGKGKVTNFLVENGNYDFVLRFNGGGNAGHTIYRDGKKIVTHHIPSGVLHGVPSIIGPNCVLYPRNFFAEIEELEAAGINCRHLIKIANNCHIVTDEHLAAESTEKRIGTTRTGNGPAYVSKYNRTGIMASEVPELSEFLIDFFKDVLNKPDLKILAEGAQGFGLDIDFGKYPFVTSSHVTLGGLMLCGFNPKSIGDVIAVGKVYETYVGAFKFQDFNDPMLDIIGDAGNEYGATTGRRRQINYIDFTTLYKSIIVNHPTQVILNKLDILEEVNHWVIKDGDRKIFAKDKEEFCNVISAFIYEINPEIIVKFSESPITI